MTGPAYPPAPAAGSNALGKFILGVSVLGDIPAFDYWRTVISQYANSPILTTIIGNIFAYLDQTYNIDTFFDQIMNIDSAEGYGLDVWGRILGVSRVLQVPVGDYFGWDQGTPGTVGWDQGQWYAGAPTTSNYSLSDAAYRPLLLVKAAANITTCSIPAINQLLLSLFLGRGNCYVQDNEDMTMDYVFEFALTPLDIAIVEQSGAIPKPAGVLANVIINP